ncbi:MAG: glycosyltransferase family 1 protein [Candidatus Margulisiibacteriota bacterium]
MNIAVNTYFLSGNKAGIGHYTERILSGIRQKLATNECLTVDNRLRLNKLIFEQVYLPLALWFGRSTVLFSPSMVLPLCSGVPSVMVVYDLVFDLFPEYYRGRVNRLYLRLFFGRSLNKAKFILAISENTRSDLVRLYNVPEEKVKVVHLAAGEEFKTVEDAALLTAVKERYRLPEKFILFVGTIEPRKNVRRLIEAYFCLPAEIKRTRQLVLCGQKGWGFAELKDWLDRQPEKKTVRFLDYVESRDLPLLYNLAELFIYPSLYEGFGLPILEAMSCGVPVITSNVSSMPEVAGEAAVLIDPKATGQLTGAMARILNDPELSRQLRQKGLEQAKKFSWEKAASATLALIKEAAK